MNVARQVHECGAPSFVSASARQRDIMGFYGHPTLCRVRLSAVEKVWMLRHITLFREQYTMLDGLYNNILREITRTYKNIFLPTTFFTPNSLCSETYIQFCQFGNERNSRKYFPPFPKFANGGSVLPFFGEGANIFFSSLEGQMKRENSVYTLFFPFSPPHPNFRDVFVAHPTQKNSPPPTELQNTDLFP